MIIIDTEGLNSVCITLLLLINQLEREIMVDMRLFTLSVLMASMLIYNSIGAIDERAIENLDLVVNLSKNITLK